VVKRFVDILWATYGKVEVFLVGNGLYLFQFADDKTKDAVLEEKLWHIANKPLILCQWTPGMQLLKFSLTSVHVWIKLHNLLMEFWNSTCLSYVASGMGKPLCANNVTEEQLRLGFARVLVEIDVDSDFPKEIEIIGINGVVVKVGIDYPWLPIKCKKCRSFGHVTHMCTKVEKNVRIPRRKEPVQQVSVQKVPPILNEKAGLVDKLGTNGEGQWTTVNCSKNTPMTRNIAEESKKLWTNSFQLLAKAEDKSMTTVK
jgi:hypothetical protein